MLEKFVCVRMVQVNSLDLSRIQFDLGLTWAVLFMNADGSIYGRYGTRSSLHRPGDVSDEGFRKAAIAALELHRGYPANRESLQGKIRPATRYRKPQDFPALARHPAQVDPRAGEWNNPTCIHCHEVDAAACSAYRAAKERIPDELLWPYPMPDAVGLVMHREERALVREVIAKSPAAAAGFKPGDELLRLEGQPLVSIADVQWILHGARDGSSLAAVVRRAGREESLALLLPPGWRRSGDTSWRQATWVYFRPDLQAEPLSPEDRKSSGLVPGAVALRITRLGTALELAGFKSGDIIVAVADRRTGIESLSQILEFVGQKTQAGEKLPLVVLREGKELKLEIPLP